MNKFVACHYSLRSPFKKGLKEKKLSKVKLEVYSSVSSDSTALLTLHTYSLVTRPCSFISHRNSPGSIQSGSNQFWHTELITRTSLLGPTGIHLIPGRESARANKVPCPRVQHHVQDSPASDSNPQSLASRARYHCTMAPHFSTQTVHPVKSKLGKSLTSAQQSAVLMWVTCQGRVGKMHISLFLNGEGCVSLSFIFLPSETHGSSATMHDPPVVHRCTDTGLVV